MDIVRGATRRCEVPPAQCHARHTRFGAVSAGSGVAADTVSATATATATATVSVSVSVTVSVTVTATVTGTRVLPSIEMRPLRRLIPLLVAVLAIQGLVALVPHEHASVTTEGQGLQARPSAGDPHRCFACSVLAPAVEQAPAAEFASAVTRTAAKMVDSATSDLLSEPALSGPRGPPRII